MNTTMNHAKRAILTTVFVQIIAWTVLALLETLVAGHRLGILSAMQLIWPIWLTLDTTFNWSKVPAFRGIAVAVNFLFAFVSGLGVIASILGLINETSGLMIGRFCLFTTITTTYLLNAFFLMRSEKHHPV